MLQSTEPQRVGHDLATERRQPLFHHLDAHQSACSWSRERTPQKLRAWGDSGKKLTPTAPNKGQPYSGCRPGSTGRRLPPGSRPAPHHPHRNGRLSTLQTETPPKGTARRAKAPVPGHLSKFRGTTGLEGRLVS